MSLINLRVFRKRSRPWDYTIFCGLKLAVDHYVDQILGSLQFEFVEVLEVMEVDDYSEAPLVCNLFQANYAAYLQMRYYFLWCIR